MTVSFHKMHGLGNDFVILDARAHPIEPSPAQVRALCDRRRGIGCDQLIRLSPSSSAEVRMDIWNADGSQAEACGNAARCVAALTRASTIETEGGALEAVAMEGEISVQLPPPRFEWDAIPLRDAMDTRPLPLGWDMLERPDAVNVGNPHLVFFVDDLEAVPLERLGAEIERDPLFPRRINVNVAQVRDNHLELRTFERGAGLTEACGTGACASAIAAIRRRHLIAPVEVRMPGGTLHVSWAPGEPILMRGAATHVFDGTVDLAALDGAVA
ncbi:diaminopimelate epimerase [Sphingomicrobium astaxanthinifaciens]|uniref:diaminopimelate epimerase n=1 Tax=Sphingomicrobium astaxanthinifaciens TaxID=1227949 RepID=UPI001FCAA668|nr:diaminopimelate epimerase [Sphingomicrobium astaxanthinifaciens]MCJ7422273.1 diaminopimelate epimerase [Sphingomicrobium astaxanthinifaciens]